MSNSNYSIFPNTRSGVSKGRIKQNLVDLRIRIGQGECETILMSLNNTKINTSAINTSNVSRAPKVYSAADPEFSGDMKEKVMIFRDETFRFLQNLTLMVIADAGIQDEFNKFSCMLDNDKEAKKMAEFGMQLIQKESADLRIHTLQAQHEVNNSHWCSTRWMPCVTYHAAENGKKQLLKFAHENGAGCDD